MAASASASSQDSLKLMGYEAYVEIKDANGLWKKAEVFKPEIVHDSKITGYIISSEGAEFRIHYRSSNIQRPDVASYYFADGRSIGGLASQATDPPNILYTCSGLQEDDFTMRPLKFAKLELTDDDNLACKEEDVVKNAGSIAIKICRAVFGSYTVSSYRNKAKGATVLSERGKKAQLSHVAAYGDAVQTARVSSISTTLTDSLNDPYCSFHFNYLSRDLLEARGIIPYAEGGAVVPLDSDSTPEIVVKKEKITKTKNSRKIIDIDDSDDESELDKLRRENAALRKKVKTEPGSSKTKPGTLIDLTLN